MAEVAEVSNQANSKPLNATGAHELRVNAKDGTGHEWDEYAGVDTRRSSRKHQTAASRRGSWNGAKIDRRRR